MQLFRDNEKNMIANSFFSGISEHSFCRLIPTGNNTVEILTDNGVFRRIDYRSKHRVMFYVVRYHDLKCLKRCLTIKNGKYFVDWFFKVRKNLYTILIIDDDKDLSEMVSLGLKQFN